MSEDSKNSVSEALNIALAIVCVLLIACDIMLMRKYRWEAGVRQQLQQEKQRLEQEKFARRQHLYQLGMQQAQEMALESRFLRHALEEALEHLQNREYQKVVSILEGEGFESMPVLHYLRAVSHAALEHDEEAIRDFSSYIALVHFSAYARLERARLYHKQGENSLAVEDLRSLLEHRPDFAPARELLEELEKEPE